MSDLPKLCFVDIETTGLDVERHEMWEIAIIVRNGAGLDIEHRWFLPVDRLEDADPVALRIGHYHERHPYGYRFQAKPIEPNEGPLIKQERDAAGQYGVQRPSLTAVEIAKITWDAVLVGANVRFDEAFLRRFLTRLGHAPGWHHRLCDVESAAGGKYAIEPPKDWGLSRLAERARIPTDRYKAHEAMSDARLARDLYDLVFLTGRNEQPRRREPIGNDHVPPVALADGVETLSAPEPADPEPAQSETPAAPSAGEAQAQIATPGGSPAGLDPDEEYAWVALGGGVPLC